jgi:nucleotide-binding universal stress UspA family protein
LGGGDLFKKILYPTDFSEEAKKVLEYLKVLKDTSEEVVVLHVIDRVVVEAYKDAFAWAGMNIKFETDKLNRKLVEKAEEKIGDIVKYLREKGFKVKYLIRIGSPWEEILKVADCEKVSIIVLGSHGCGKLGCELEKLIGSTAENVIRHSKFPVMVVK